MSAAGSVSAAESRAARLPGGPGEGGQGQAEGVDTGREGKRHGSPWRLPVAVVRGSAALPRGPSVSLGDTASGPAQPGWGRAREGERAAGLRVEGCSGLGQQPTGKALPKGSMGTPRPGTGGSCDTIWNNRPLTGPRSQLWRPLLPAALHPCPVPPANTHVPTGGKARIPQCTQGPSGVPKLSQTEATEQPQLEVPPVGRVHSCPPHTCDLEGMLSGALQRADAQLHQW